MNCQSDARCATPDDSFPPPFPPSANISRFLSKGYAKASASSGGRYNRAYSRALFSVACAQCAVRTAFRTLPSLTYPLSPLSITSRAQKTPGGGVGGRGSSRSPVRSPLLARKKKSSAHGLLACTGEAVPTKPGITQAQAVHKGLGKSPCGGDTQCMDLAVELFRPLGR